MTVESRIEQVLDLLNPDEATVRKGKERQKCVGRNVRTDYLPLILGGIPVPERKEHCQTGKPYCQYNREEQFYDERKMLFEQIFGLISTVRGKSDAQLSVEPRMGAGFLPSCLGLKQDVFQDKDPWLRQRLSKRQIVQLQPEDLEDIRGKGLIPRALKYIKYFRRKLEGKASVYVSFTWGPFSLAHLIRGDKIFIDLYRHPDLVHHLMRITTKLYVKCSAVLKESADEPSHQGYHGRYYMDNSGVWSNEDTIVLLSPTQAEEFVFPYLRKAFKPFGGAVVHLCGRADHLLEPLLDLSEIKGINLGEPEKQQQSYEQIMKTVLGKGKTYYGGWPKHEGEDTETYFKRMLKPLKGEKRGLLLSYNPNKREKEAPEKVMKLWHSLQK